MRIVHPILFSLILLLAPAATAEQLLETRNAANRYETDIQARFGWVEDPDEATALRLAGATAAQAGERAAAVASYERAIAVGGGNGETWLALAKLQRERSGGWVGRPDGSYAPGRMGRGWAAPILFEAFDLLKPLHGASAMLAPSGPVPDGAILGDNAALPLALRRFQPADELPRPAPRVVEGPKLAFPEDGATVDLAGDGPVLPSLPLEATGGELPYIWLVNGSVLAASPFRRQAEWHPDGRGEARITVIDRLGRSASAEIWIE